MTRLLIKRKSYTRRDGTRVKATTYYARDRGEPGRTPKARRWYEPTVETGWRKDLPQRTRIARMVRAHGGDLLASARALQALANVTTDRETKQKAQADAKLLFRKYAKR